MCQYEFTTEEVVLMRDMLDACLRELRDEIRHTDSRAYRELLKQREALMLKLNEHLGLQAPAAVPA
jgi:hypothetical protein